MRTRGINNKWVELSLEGEISGVKPGDQFTSNGFDKLVIGFSSDENTAKHPLTKIWTLTKNEIEIGYWPKEGEIEKIKPYIRKAEKPITIETVEERLKRFLNS